MEEDATYCQVQLDHDNHLESLFNSSDMLLKQNRTAQSDEPSHYDRKDI